MATVTPPAPAEPRDPGAAGRGSSSLGSHYRGLDGLRALAVLGVLLFHAGLTWLPGGFLGVSLFFTLSGFLITGILIRNPGRGLRPFWTRRARRLLPAAFLALAAIVVFGATVASHQQAVELPGNIAAAATWTANWKFIASGQSYADVFSGPSPVQHFWSLAIEEQFYLVFPVLLLLVVSRTRSLKVVAGTLAGAAVVSTLWMAFLHSTGASLDRLYYGTDTRVAELLVGGALAVIVAHTGTDWSERGRRVWSWAGLGALALILVAWWRLTLADGPLWTGGFLALAVLCCVAIVGVLADRGPLPRILSWWPLVWTGRISYGLYLYHFPIYLWLTEARTGLGPYPLLVLRLAVTYSVALLSYRFVEQPVLRGAKLGLPRGSMRVAVVPIAMGVVVLATVLTVHRSGDDPLSAVRAGAAASRMPKAATDGVLDLLVIPGRADDPVIGRLAADTAANPKVKLTVAPPLKCSGGLVAFRGGRTCASFAKAWPELIRRHDPDAVIVYADDWAGQSLESLTGKRAAELPAATADILAPALDALSARGAPIVWFGSGLNFADALRRSALPFNQAMARLEAKRGDIYRGVGNNYLDPTQLGAAEYDEKSAQALLTDASLYQRRAGTGLPRVMVVGDSQSLSLGYGLDRWADDGRHALVWNRGIEACGVAVDGTVREFGGAATSSTQRCRDVLSAWPGQLEAFKPDMVVVFSSLVDIQDRKLPGESRYRSIGDPKFDRFLLDQYIHAVDVLSATGAKVVWMTPPCMAIKPAPGQTAVYDAKNIAHVDQKIIPALVRARPGKVAAFDLAKILCPDGEPLQSAPGTGSIRPDGVHFSVDGAIWFARNYGEGLLRRGGL